MTIIRRRIGRGLNRSIWGAWLKVKFAVDSVIQAAGTVNQQHRCMSARFMRGSDSEVYGEMNARQPLRHVRTLRPPDRAISPVPVCE